MFNRLFRLYASAQGPTRLLLRMVWEIIRRTLMLLGDPSYRTIIHGKEIILPVSHKLPIYVANYRYYDALPGRISKYLRDQNGCLTMIDVGANIGDTILYCYQNPCDKFLAIEVNPFFIKYLTQNCAPIPNLELVKVFCSAEDNSGIHVNINAVNGTARALKDPRGIVISERKLDTIITEHPQFATCNFLKVDTDGGDFDVIRGAHKTIERAKPVVFLECDIFNNRNYVSDFSNSMEFFLRTGYEAVIAYDNFGYLYEVFAIKDYAKFKHALFHQLISRFGYFDLLVLAREHLTFVDLELSYYANAISDENRRFIAKNIVGL